MAYGDVYAYLAHMDPATDGEVVSEVVAPVEVDHMLRKVEEADHCLSRLCEQERKPVSGRRQA